MGYRYTYFPLFFLTAPYLFSSQVSYKEKKTIEKFISNTYLAIYTDYKGNLIKGEFASPQGYAYEGNAPDGVGGVMPNKILSPQDSKRLLETLKREFEEQSKDEKNEKKPRSQTQ